MLTIRRMLEILSQKTNEGLLFPRLIEPPPDKQTADNTWTDNGVTALDYYGLIEFKTETGLWCVPRRDIGRVTSDRAWDLWCRNCQVRLTERGRGKLASMNVPME